MTRNEWRKRKGRSSSFVRKSTRFAIYARDNFDCVYCRSVFPPPFDGAGLHLDHVVPRSRGGSNDPSNLVTACARCNSGKQHGHEVFLKRLHNGAGGKKWRQLRSRIRRQLRKPINRELGRWLAAMAAKRNAHAIPAGTLGFRRMRPATLAPAYEGPDPFI